MFNYLNNKIPVKYNWIVLLSLFCFVSSTESKAQNKNNFTNKVVIVDTVYVDSLVVFNFPFEFGESGYTLNLTINYKDLDTAKIYINNLLNGTPKNKDSMERRLLVLYDKFNATIHFGHERLSNILDMDRSIQKENVELDEIYSDSRLGGFTIFYKARAKVVRGFVDYNLYRQRYGQNSRTITGSKHLYLKFIVVIE